MKNIDAYTECEFNIEDPYGIFDCCGGLWDSMDNAATWRDWIKRAKKVKRFIKKKG